jgi:arylsulfatase A-like enzyme
MPKSANSPNVIVFFTDQQRWDTTGLHGNPLDLTLNLDRVAREGTHVRYSFTCQPVCGPARSSMQTGLYASQTGCHTNGIPLNPELPTLATWFGEAGYRTGYIGKWHLAAEDPVPSGQRGGYQDWLAANTLEFTSDAYDTVMYDGSGEARKLPGYRVDALTDAAIDYVFEHQDDPFFLFISYLEPHHQNHRDDYPAPTGYRERYEGRWLSPDLAALSGTAHQQFAGYCGMVRRLDEAYGRLLDALQSLDLLDDTIVLFTSDHGNHFKTRNDEYKRSPHESSIRVPTVLTGPGFFGGGEIRELVSLVDLPPTLIDAAGLDVPDNLPGRSLLDLIERRDAEPWPSDVLIQVSESQTGRAIRTKRWKFGVKAPDLVSTRAGWSDSYHEAELYDLVADQHELHNLIHHESHADLCRELGNRMLERMSMVGEPSATIVPAEKHHSGQRRVLELDLRS